MNMRITGKLLLDWTCSTFGDKVAQNQQERAMRLFEEAAELAQAAGVPADKSAAILARTYSRPAGAEPQEAAQVLVTLLSYCAQLGIDLEFQFEQEVNRCIANKPALKAKYDAKVLAGTTSGGSPREPSQAEKG